MANRSVLESQYHKVAIKNSGVFLGPYTGRVDDKVRWKCQEGHEWYAAFKKVRYEDSWCPICFRARQKVSEEDYHLLAKGRGGFFLGGYTGNTKEKARWKCGECGHTWSVSYNVVSSGCWCPKCAGKARVTPEQYKDIAREKAGKWIGEKLPKTTRRKTMWECAIGHKWEASYNSLQFGSWCPICAYGVKLENDYHQAAKEKGGKWVGDIPNNVHGKTLWECEKGHQWSASFNNIVNGNRSWCPECAFFINGAKASKPQVELANMIGGIINHRDLGYYIDVAFPEEKIAIEYDCWYWHKKGIEKDRKRTKKLIGRGWRVLRIKTMSDMPSRKKINSALNRIRSGSVYEEIVMKGWGGEEWSPFPLDR